MQANPKKQQMHERKKRKTKHTKEGNATQNITSTVHHAFLANVRTQRLQDDLNALFCDDQFRSLLV
jgi:hypothetical protein